MEIPATDYVEMAGTNTLLAYILLSRYRSATGSNLHWNIMRKSFFFGLLALTP